MLHNYTQEQKAKIKANAMNRTNCLHIRTITTNAYRDFQAAERILINAPPALLKELTNKFNDAKTTYEERLEKFKLYKEIFPDLVQ